MPGQRAAVSGHGLTLQTKRHMPARGSAFVIWAALRMPEAPGPRLVVVGSAANVGQAQRMFDVFATTLEQTDDLDAARTATLRAVDSPYTHASDRPGGRVAKVTLAR